MSSFDTFSDLFLTLLWAYIFFTKATQTNAR